MMDNVPMSMPNGSMPSSVNGGAMSPMTGMANMMPGGVPMSSGGGGMGGGGGGGGGGMQGMMGPGMMQVSDRL